MRIGVISPYEYPYPGGVQRHIFSLGREFQARGHQVKIIGPSSQEEEELEAGIIKASSVVIPLPFSGSIARVSISPRMYHRVKSILQEERFDVVHLHEPMQPHPLMVLRHSQALNVGTFHAHSETEHYLYRYGRRVLKRFMNKLDGKIAVSTAARETVARYFPGEYTIIPNGIDLDYFGAEDAELLPGLMDGRPNVLFVGRLERRKGFEYLLDAFPLVKEAIPEVRLVVVGAYDKEDKEPYVRYARQRGIRGVRFVGYVPDEELRRYYASCHVFCAPSTGYESFGLILLEAMAAGKAIVASRIDGYREVLTHQQEGLLVPPGDSRAIAEAVISLLRNPARREEMGRAGQGTARRYSWARVADQVLGYFHELAASRKVISP